jgi:hypothetical protein
MSDGYVYVFKQIRKDNKVLYKIGYSKNITSRFCGYKTHAIEPTVAIWICKCYLYREFEQWIKYKFKKYRHRGEWYFFDNKIDSVLEVLEENKDSFAIVEEFESNIKIVELNEYFEYYYKYYIKLKPKSVIKTELELYSDNESEYYSESDSEDDSYNESECDYKDESNIGTISNNSSIIYVLVNNLGDNIPINKINKTINCGDCGAIFLRKFNLQRHQNTYKGSCKDLPKGVHSCTNCKKLFTRKNNMRFHMKTCIKKTKILATKNKIK